MASDPATQSKVEENMEVEGENGDDAAPRKNVLSLPELSKPLDTMAQAALDASAQSYVRLDQLEMDTRSHLLSITDGLVKLVRNRPRGSPVDRVLWMQCQEEEEDYMIDIQRFLEGCIDFCLWLVRLSHRAKEGGLSGSSAVEYTERDRELLAGAEGMGNAARLPFMLLEDAVDTLPLSKCKLLWVDGIEVWSDRLCDPLLFESGKLIFLRLCNKILTKKLSRERNAEFSGRLLMFMASVYPLSERSALNVLGKFNLDNVTEYEDEAAFEEAMITAHQMDGFDDDEEDLANDVVKVKKDRPSVDPSAQPKGGESGVIDYQLYRNFWGIQKFMSDPNSMLSSDAAFNQFASGAKSIISAFECHPFPAENLKQAQERWLLRKKKPVVWEAPPAKTSSNGSHPDVEQEGTPEAVFGENADTDNIARHQKYLTNSQLLRLQLRDPELRLQFLAQLLVVCHFLEHAKPPSSSGGGGGGGASEEKKSASLEVLRKRTEDLMMATPPNGAEQFETLLWLLQKREPIWRKWKEEKCKPFERRNEGEDDELLAKGRTHRKREKQVLMRRSMEKKKAPYAQMDVTKDLPMISRDLAGSVPKLESFIEDYVDALDPEAGIEDEYHPKHDPVFCWRALRLLSKDHLNRFSKVRTIDGDFEGVVRDVWKEEKGIDIPEPPPPPPPPPAPEVKTVPEPEPQAAEVKEEDAEKPSAMDVDKATSEQDDKAGSESSKAVSDAAVSEEKAKSCDGPSNRPPDETKTLKKDEVPEEGEEINPTTKPSSTSAAPAPRRGDVPPPAPHISNGGANQKGNVAQDIQKRPQFDDRKASHADGRVVPPRGTVGDQQHRGDNTRRVDNRAPATGGGDNSRRVDNRAPATGAGDNSRRVDNRAPATGGVDNSRRVDNRAPATGGIDNSRRADNRAPATVGIDNSRRVDNRVPATGGKDNPRRLDNRAPATGGGEGRNFPSGGGTHDNRSFPSVVGGGGGATGAGAARQDGRNFDRGFQGGGGDYRGGPRQGGGGGGGGPGGSAGGGQSNVTPVVNDRKRPREGDGEYERQERERREKDRRREPEAVVGGGRTDGRRHSDEHARRFEHRDRERDRRGGGGSGYHRGSGGGGGGGANSGGGGGRRRRS